MHTVSLEKASSYDRPALQAAMVRLLAPFGGMAAFVNNGERVLLKPNMLYGKAPECAVTTHPEVLRAVIGQVREAGGIPLVGDSPGFGDIRKVAEKTGLLRVVEETGAELVGFTDCLLYTSPSPRD